jgi:hypothetical protein
MILKSGKQKINTTGVAEKLALSAVINSICVQAKLNNGASIFIGGKDDQDIELEKGDSITFDGVDNISKIYIKGTAGQGVNFIYETN